MRRTVTLCIAIAALASTSAIATGQVLQLKDGDVLVGKVEAHEGGLTFERLDNGGVLDLTWDQLSVESANKLKRMFGLIVEEDGEIMVTADYLEFELAGGVKERIVGRIIDQDETTIVLRRQGVEYPVPRSKIKARDTRQVPAMDVYTAAEFYNEKLAEYAPGDDADKHILLAETLMRVRDYERAGEHLEKAEELGGGRQPRLLESRIKRLALFKVAAAERELLDRIKVALVRREFPRGLELIEDYESKFEDGKFRAEFERLKSRLAKAREQYLVRKVCEIWDDTAYSLARKKATEAGLSFEGAKEYAEDQMGQDIRARVQKLLGITAEEVEEAWGARLDSPAAPRAQRYSYGVGSWTLGAQAVKKGTVQERSEEQQEEKSERQKQNERMQRRIERAMERARRTVGQGGAGQGEEETPQQWWEDATVAEKHVFVRAYYVEYGGDMVVENAHVNPCVSCAGEGRMTVLGTSGKPQKIDCPVCHGTRYRRWIRAH